MCLLFRPLTLAVPLMIITLTACCPVDRQLLGDPRDPYPLHSDPKSGEIVHLPTGRLVSQKEMIEVAADARVVYVGETHDNPASHRLELDLLKAFSEIRPQRQALGMEMFVRSQQPVLDRWVAGKLTEKEFLRESRWFDNWKSDFTYYRDLLNFARDHKIPIVALNAERGVVDALRVKPVDQPDSADKARLPEMDMTDPYHRAMVAAYFSDHAHGKMQLEGFFRAQTAWDETMAESVARYLASPEGKKRHLLVIAGGNHVNFGFGIPRRAFRRLPASYVMIGGQEIRIPEDKKKEMMNVDLPVFPMAPYDFLAYIDYEELPKTGVSLGVRIEPARPGPGLVVRDVVPASIAEREGLHKDDLLLSLDGEPLRDIIDLIYPLKQKRPGDTLSLKVDRNGKIMIMEIPTPSR